MSVFSEAAKAELARIQPDKECCQKAELIALMRADASVQIGTSGRYISFKTEAATVARKIYNMLRESFGVRCEIAIVRKNRLKKNVVYLVRTTHEKDMVALISSSGAMSPGEQDVALKTCCSKSYLRGTFLGCGSVADPEKSYHLEMVLESEEDAVYNTSLAARHGFRLRQVTRKGKSVCYLKDADEISQFLALMGANASVLELESVRVVREMRNGVNRLVNCETANVDKAVSASLRQGDAIRFLVDKMGMSGLPENVQELAALRLQYPDVCLRELGELTAVPLTKSGVNHRMRKLMELAAENGFDNQT